MRSEAIHAELWAGARSAVTTHPDSVAVGLYVTALNELIDLHTTRLMAVTTRIALDIWVVIALVAVLAFALVGFYDGLLGSRNLFALVILVLVFAAVVVLMVDLDCPGEGLMRLSQQALLDLQQQLTVPTP